MKITDSQEKLKQIKTAGVVLKPSSPELKDIFLNIKDYFEEQDIDILIESHSANMIGIESDDIYNFEELCERSDFLVAIGGDGTLISVTRRSCKYNMPVLGINLGTLGFLTDTMYEEVPDFVEKLKKGQYRIDNRMMIEANANINRFVAFNDIVITRKTVTSMVKINAKIDGKLFNSYYGDGLIISTPTGSTAYNLSSGGPVVYPLTEAFIVTPISPHSLTQRPLVLPVDFEIEFSTPDSSGAIAIIDGQDIYEFGQNESIKIKIASKRARLIHRLERNYFEVLNKKLRWGN